MGRVYECPLLNLFVVMDRDYYMAMIMRLLKDKDTYEVLTNNQTANFLRIERIA